jgi:hypothetical protein
MHHLPDGHTLLEIPEAGFAGLGDRIRRIGRCFIAGNAIGQCARAYRPFSMEHV